VKNCAVRVHLEGHTDLAFTLGKVSLPLNFYLCRELVAPLLPGEAIQFCNRLSAVSIAKCFTAYFSLWGRV